MRESVTNYQSYLLRLWQDSPRSAWRASAQSIRTQKIIYFADLDTLFTFLAAQTIHSEEELSSCSTPLGLEPFSFSDKSQ